LHFEATAEDIAVMMKEIIHFQAAVTGKARLLTVVGHEGAPAGFFLQGVQPMAHSSNFLVAVHAYERKELVLLQSLCRKQFGVISVQLQYDCQYNLK